MEASHAMTPWAAQALQFVWFTPQAQLCRPADVFRTIFGDDAAQTVSNKHVSPHSPFFGVAATDGRDFSRRVTTQPGRIDLTIQPFVPPESGAISMPLIPEWEIIYASVRQALPEACVHIPEVVRLAFIASMAVKLPSLQEVVRRIESFTGFDLSRLSDASDLLFQINRRRWMSKPSGVEMNRLLRLNALQMQLLTFQLDPPDLANQQALQQQMATELSLDFAAQFTLDLNTVPSARPFSSDDQAAILEELCGESDRIRNLDTLQALVDIDERGA